MRPLAILFLLTATPALAMELRSPDLVEGGKVPLSQVYARCGGKNIAPALAWSGAPDSTRSFALTMIDQDVKPALWSHWVVLNLPPTTINLAKGAALPRGARVLASDFGDLGYDGPCPPAGSGLHHYRFTIWAMPKASPVPDASSAAALTAWLGHHAIASASLTATFSR